MSQKNQKNQKNQIVDNSALEALMKELAELKAMNASLAKERDEAKAAAQRKGGRGRESLPEVCGHNATSVMRALIALGATGAEMNKALATGYQIYASPSGMNTQISRIDKWLKASATDREGKDLKGFAPAPLTKEQVSEVCKHAGINEPSTLPDWCKK